MTTTVPTTASTYQPIGPSVIVRWVMAPMTKVLNPLVRLLAGRPHFFMAGLVHHVGRRSGKQFVTPVGARYNEGSIVIPLTFGSRSDWCRNVLANGGCAIRTAGRDYEARDPAVLGRAQARPAVRATFNPLERAAFRMLGIRQFMVLTANSVDAGASSDS